MKHALVGVGGGVWWAVRLMETRMLVDVILLQNLTQEVRLFQSLNPSHWPCPQLTLNPP